MVVGSKAAPKGGASGLQPDRSFGGLSGLAARGDSAAESCMHEAGRSALISIKGASHRAAN